MRKPFVVVGAIAGVVLLLAVSVSVASTYYYHHDSTITANHATCVAQTLHVTPVTDADRTAIARVLRVCE